jgi:hypothetical protein
MKIKSALSLFTSLLLFAAPAMAEETNKTQSVARIFSSTQTVLNAESSASEVLAACRNMLPRSKMKLKGSIILRNRKGITQNEYDYTLWMNRSNPMETMRIILTPRDKTNELAEVTVSKTPDYESRIWMSENGSKEAKLVPSLLANVMDTDVTWLDLTLDFLWWTNPVFEEERETETVHGQRCAVILVAPPKPIEGMAAVRLWADKKTGCLMQAEQLDPQMNPMRRLWGTRVKKFGERWMANVLEVETLGSGHRTKIIVDSLKE